MGGMFMLAAKRWDFGRWFDVHGVTIIATIVVAVVVTVVVQVLVRRFRRRLEGSPSVTQELNLQRIATLTGALSTASVVAIWTVAILVILGNLNVSLGPLLASAGVAGVALGFGAQSLVRDTLSGFSNFGTNVAWIAAPGEAIISTYPMGTYAAAWGTSFSTPFATGAAALLAEMASISNKQAADSDRAKGQTVMENIRYGRLDATDEECIRAAQLADADHFIRQLPQGYQTKLSERASNLSQGQRQMLSIARAVVVAVPRQLLRTQRLGGFHHLQQRFLPRLHEFGVPERRNLHRGCAHAHRRPGILGLRFADEHPGAGQRDERWERGV